MLAWGKYKTKIDNNIVTTDAIAEFVNEYDENEVIFIKDVQEVFNSIENDLKEIEDKLSQVKSLDDLGKPKELIKDLIENLW